MLKSGQNGVVRVVIFWAVLERAIEAVIRLRVGENFPTPLCHLRR